METWQILEKAAALIEEKGWCQGNAVMKTGEFCVAGALNHLGDLHNCGVGIADAMDALTDEVGGHIPKWNDHQDRTQDEVIETMRRVAQKEWEKNHGDLADS